MPRPKESSRFGLNEPAAGQLARASHRINATVAVLVALLPGLWTFFWCLVTTNGLATLSNLCLSVQLVALGAILCAQAVTFNVCEYTPLRDWLEAYTGFLFLYRGRAEMLAVLSVLSLGNTQWDAPTRQLVITLGSSLAAFAAAGVSLYIALVLQPELDETMSRQLEIAAEQRQTATREAALEAYGDGTSEAESTDWSQVPRDSMSAVEALKHGGGDDDERPVQYP